jgi:hypothetical protein
MKAKFYIVLLITCFLISAYAIGQTSVDVTLPSIIPPSPQAAQFNRYGEIPVGYTTGVPQIEVPIYTLSTGWIDIPISLSYHASGFRVREIPSPVGLGWVLNAGGVISMSIEMLPDKKYINDFLKIKSVAQADSLKKGQKKTKQFGMGTDIDLSNYNSWMYWDKFFFDPSQAQLDTRSDRYSYNYLGNSGIARYHADTKELMPVPYSPIKIKCIYNGQLNGITSYTITDTKGIIYEFACPENISVEAFTHTTSWYLTKIIYPGRENDPIVFTYTTGEKYYDTGYTTSIRTLWGLTSHRPNAIYSPSSSITGNTTATITTCNSPLLKTIAWRNTTITFNYVFDRKDQRKDRLSSIEVRQGSNLIRRASLDNNKYFGSNSGNYRMKLEGVTLTGSNANENKETYTFNYNSAAPPIYYLVYFRDPTYQHPNNVHCSEDYWGYYNGTSSAHCFPNDIGNLLAQSVPPGVSGNSILYYTINRNPNEAHTKTCMLEEIVYPTKGKTRFEYEINRGGDYGYVNSNNGAVGGLRLKKRINYSADGQILDIKEYEYIGEATMRIDASLFSYGRKVVDFEVLQFSWGQQVVPVNLSSRNAISTPLSSLTGWSTSPVFYSYVKEYNGTTAGSISGWTEYRYDLNIHEGLGNCHHEGDYIPFAFSNHTDCDRGETKSLPVSTTVYDNNGQIVRKTETTYKRYSIPDIPTGLRMTNRCDYRPLFINGIAVCDGGFQCVLDNTTTKQARYLEFLDDIICFNTYALQDVSFPERTTETDYANGQPATVKTTQYGYQVANGKPMRFIPNSVSTTNSNGETFSNTTIFHSHPLLTEWNMLDYPASESFNKNGEYLNTKTTVYPGISASNKLLLPSAIYFKQRDMSIPYHTILTYHNYDNYGNPVHILIEGGMNIVYLWSYNGMYPIAEIKNATFAEVEAAAKTIFSVTGIHALSALETPNETKLMDGSLQKALPNASVTTYAYRPLIGMISSTAPNGIVTRYDYDTSGRLAVSKMHNNILARYRYAYQNGSEAAVVTY